MSTCQPIVSQMIRISIINRLDFYLYHSPLPLLLSVPISLLYLACGQFGDTSSPAMLSGKIRERY